MPQVCAVPLHSLFRTSKLHSGFACVLTWAQRKDLLFLELRLTGASGGHLAQVHSILNQGEAVVDLFSDLLAHIGPILSQRGELRYNSCQHSLIDSQGGGCNHLSASYR